MAGRWGQVPTLDAHSSLGVTLRSLAKKQEPITCVKLTEQLLAPARPPDLHSIAHLAGACHCLLA